jgi:alpha 1,2-mannosyltransferase
MSRLFKKLLAVIVLTLISTFMSLGMVGSGTLYFPSFFKPYTIHETLNQETERSLFQVDNFKKITTDKKQKANATFLALVRNSELRDLQYSIRQLEETFNSKYQYPYVFLNDQEFTEEFKQGIQQVISTNAYFGVIPKEHWSIPSWIDKNHFAQRLFEMAANNLPYGGMESYHHMCRFYSGFFYKQPLLQQFDYYWRIEPDVDYLCTLDYDPFLFMKTTNKIYGFNIIPPEFMDTVKDLWPTVLKYLKDNNKPFPPLLKAFGNEANYNGVHFW